MRCEILTAGKLSQINGREKHNQPAVRETPAPASDPGQSTGQWGGSTAPKALQMELLELPPPSNVCLCVWTGVVELVEHNSWFLKPPL